MVRYNTPEEAKGRVIEHENGLPRRHTASVLKLMAIIGRRAPITRKELREISQFSHPTIIRDVGRLIAAGLVRELPTKDEGRRGPRTAALDLKRDDKALLCVEVRSNLLVGVVMDFAGTVHHRARVLSPSPDCGRTVALIGSLVETMRGEVPAGMRPLGLCVAFPGHVSGLKVVRTFHGRKGWDGFPLARALEERFGVETFVVNNADAYIRAERSFASRSSERNVLGVYLDNGMGMGIVVNGAVYEGDTFAAGEIGHLSAGSDDEPCHCGRRGCIERLGSEVYLLEKLNAHLGTSFPTLHDLLTEGALGPGDRQLASELIDRGLTVLSRGIVTAVTLLNPARVLVHGGIVALAPGNVARVREHVASHAYPASAGVDIELSSLDETACARGAGVVFVERFYDVRQRYVAEALGILG